MSTIEVCQLALNVARNVGWSVFPCSQGKTPTWPKDRGGHGYKDASSESERIAWLWQHWPGPLIGVATGPVSQNRVLNIDLKHPDATLWWEENAPRLLPTRTYETRSGGFHLYYSAGQGIGSTTSRICSGVDTRGEGGYVIHWHTAGLMCHDHSPSAPWPAWLRDALPPPPPLAASYRGPAAPPDASSVAGVLHRLSVAQEGERDAVLFWAACRLRDAGVQAETLLIPVAIASGMSERDARRTIDRAQGRGGGP